MTALTHLLFDDLLETRLPAYLTEEYHSQFHTLVQTEQVFLNTLTDRQRDMAEALRSQKGLCDTLEMEALFQAVLALSGELSALLSPAASSSGTK